MARTKFTSLDMVRFVKFSEKNQHLKPLERLKKYNSEYPELSEEEKLANIKKWLGKDLSDGIESLIKPKKALPLHGVRKCAPSCHKPKKEICIRPHGGSCKALNCEHFF